MSCAWVLFSLLYVPVGGLQHSKGAESVMGMNATDDAASPIKTPFHQPLHLLKAKFNYFTNESPDIANANRKHSPWEAGGKGMQISAVLLLAAAVTSIGVIAVDIAIRGDRKTRILKAITSLHILWVAILGMSIAVACLSIFRGQGAHYDLLGTAYRPTSGLRYDQGLFTAACVSGLFAVYMIAAAFIVRKLYPSKGYELLNETALQQGQSPPSESFIRFNHARYFLLMGVFLCNATSMTRSTESIVLWDSYATFANSFVLLALVTVSGYYSAFRQSELVTKRLERPMKLAVIYYWNQALTILFCYYVFRPLLAVTYKHNQGYQENVYRYYVPVTTMNLLTFTQTLFGYPILFAWYVQSLVAWLLMAPYWMRLSYPITVSVALACLLPYLPEGVYKDGFSPAVTLELFPFFVIGASMRKHSYERYFDDFAKGTYTRLASIAGICLWASFSAVSPFSFAEWRIFASPGTYKDKAFDNQWWYPIGKVGWILGSTCIIFMVVALMPSQQTYFSKASNNWLVPYLSNVYVFLLLVASGFYGRNLDDPFDPPQLSPGRQCALVFMMLSVPNLLFYPPLAKLLKFIVAPPILEFLFISSMETDVDKSLGKGCYEKKSIEKRPNERRAKGVPPA